MSKGMTFVVVLSTLVYNSAHAQAAPTSVPSDREMPIADIALVTAASGLGLMTGWFLGPLAFGEASSDSPGLNAGVAGAVILSTAAAAIVDDLIVGQETGDAWGAAIIGIIPGTLAGIGAAAVSDGSIPAIVIGFAVGQGIFTAMVAPVLRTP